MSHAAGDCVVSTCGLWRLQSHVAAAADAALLGEFYFITANGPLGTERVSYDGIYAAVNRTPQNAGPRASVRIHQVQRLRKLTTSYLDTPSICSPTTLLSKILL